MRKYRDVLTVAGFAIVFLFAAFGLAVSTRTDGANALRPTPTPAKPESLQKEYRDAVLKRIDMGDRVSVPEDRIAYLKGEVRLVPKKAEKSPEAMNKSMDRRLPASDPVGIETVARKLGRAELRDGLNAFSRTATEEQRSVFLNVGGTFDLDALNAETRAAPNPSEDPTKKCYQSCETIFHIVCKEVCKWDCRIVNTERVCEQSCETICPEIRNVVCKRVCD